MLAWATRSLAANHAATAATTASTRNNGTAISSANLLVDKTPPRRQPRWANGGTARKFPQRRDYRCGPGKGKPALLTGRQKASRRHQGVSLSGGPAAQDAFVAGRVLGGAGRAPRQIPRE